MAGASLRLRGAWGSAALAVAVVAVLCLGRATAQPNTDTTVDGTLDVVAITAGSGQADDVIYSLRMSNGYRRQIFFTEDPPSGLVSGMKVRVYIDHTSEHTPRKRELYVYKLEVLQTPSGSKDYTVDNKGSPYAFRSITFVMTICNVQPTVTKEITESMWFTGNASAPSQQWTMQNYFSNCSYDKVKFDRSTNVVVPVNVPCSGTSRTGWRFSSTQCRIDEVYGWAEYAEDYVKQNLNINYQNYQNRILILPKNTCGFGGLGTVGCGNYCYAWIKGDQAKILDTFMHELGHNMGLMHSSTPGSEYGDVTSPMGSCCDNPRCYNGPNSWQLGWSKLMPGGALNTKSLDAGKWAKFDIPALSQSDTSVVQILPDWAVPQNKTPPVFYLSYRTNDGYDAGLNKKYTNQVSIHVYNGSTGYANNGFLSELRQTVPGGTTWSDGINQFRVMVLSAGAASASVQVCRYTADAETPETCNDGLDNDCNGLADDQDPACQKYAGLPSCNNNGKCEANLKESASNCPKDCPPVCGDGFCDADRGEGASSCPKDCPARCGDGFCDTARGETTASCVVDCPVVTCGDGKCMSPFETNKTCPRDCCPASKCGDGFCDAYGGENCITCPQDCPGVRTGNKPFCCGSPTQLYGCANKRCNTKKQTCRTTCDSSTPVAALTSGKKLHGLRG